MIVILFMRNTHKIKYLIQTLLPTADDHYWPKAKNGPHKPIISASEPQSNWFSSATKLVLPARNENLLSWISDFPGYGWDFTAGLPTGKVGLLLA
jgi:hypothetical protein